MDIGIDETGSLVKQKPTQVENVLMWNSFNEIPSSDIVNDSLKGTKGDCNNVPNLNWLHIS